MVREVLELVFECTNEASVLQLWHAFVHPEQCIRAWHSDLGDVSAENLATRHPSNWWRQEPAVLHINLQQIRLGLVDIERPLLRFIHHDKMYIVEVIFDQWTAHGGSFIADLLEASAALAAQVQALDWFCGMEPASDETTRLFTQDRPGPLYEASPSCN